MNINLTKPNELPEEFISRLRQIEALCLEFKFSEQLVEHSRVTSLVRDIDAFCMEQKIVGIHYTRAVPENIREKGLLIRSGNEIRSAFLNEFGHLFTKTEINTINESWENYFVPSQSSVRDGRIFFNFTESALNNGGAEYLLGFYGGEQVSMCFEFDSPIGKKLRNIGEALIVRCALDPNNVSTFIEYPWGKILVSSYHLLVSPDAYGIDQDGYQSVPVKPENIIEIDIYRDRPL